MTASLMTPFLMLIHHGQAKFLYHGLMQCVRLLPATILLSKSSNSLLVLPSPRPWDFPPSIDGDISCTDDLMEVDDPEGVVSLD